MRDPGLRSDRSVEIRVGVLALISAAVLIFGIFWLSDTEIGGTSLTVYGVTADARQITDGSRIFLRGVDVGSVRRVQLEENQVVLELDVRYSGTLPADTRGVIRPAGLLGNQMVMLLPGAASQDLASGDTLSLDSAAGLETLAGELGDQANDVLSQARDLLSEQTIANIQSSTEAFSGAMNQLQGLVAEQRGTIGALLGNLDVVSAELAAAGERGEIGRTMANIDSATARLSLLAASLDTTSRALASITQKMDEGDGSLGKLVNDDQLYLQLTGALENLQVATEEIAMLTKDIRERPERYLRGLKFSVF